MAIDEMDRRCPGCGEDRQVEFDPCLRTYFCSVCSESWRPRVRGRLIPQIREPHLPGTLPALNPDESELP